MPDAKVAWTSRTAVPTATEVTEEEVARRKEFLQFGEADVEKLMGLREVARKYAGPIIEEFYGHILSFEETSAFFRDPKVLERVKRLQKEYFIRLTEGDYGAEYVASRLRIGTMHERVGLAPKWYLGMYTFYLRAVAHRLREAFAGEPERAWSSFLSLMKLVFMDIGLAVDTYIMARESTMRKQQEAIRELSTPVLQIRDRLLLLPIIGVIDTYRARLVTESLRRVRGGAVGGAASRRGAPGHHRSPEPAREGLDLRRRPAAVNLVRRARTPASRPRPSGGATRFR